MRKVAVIGSNCFTGSHFVSALLDMPDVDVIAISRSPQPNLVFLPYDIDHGRLAFHRIDMVQEFDRLVALLDAEKPEQIINVAALSEVALSIERPNEYYAINTLAVVRLADFLRRQDWLDRYVHISSAEIYGSCPNAVTEDQPFRPSTPYAASKAAADFHLDTITKTNGFPITTVRSTNVYGRHQQLFKIIPRTVIYLKLGQPIELHGGGKAIKSFVHIRDVVRGALLAIDQRVDGAFHFSEPSEDSIADVVRMVCKLTGCDFDKHVIMVGERQGQDQRYWLDCCKAKRLLGWAPEVKFNDGLSEVIEWIERDWEQIQHLPMTYQHKV